MATFTQQITDTANDGSGRIDVVSIDTGDPAVQVRGGGGGSSDYRTVLGFAGVTIPPGVIITSATLTLQAYNRADGDTVHVYGLPGASSAAVTGSDLTSATTSGSSTFFAASGQNMVDVTSPVAELLGSGGWSQGDPLKLRLQPGSDSDWVNFYDVSGGAANAATLTVDYTNPPSEGQAPLDVQVSLAGFGQAPVLPPSEGQAPLGVQVDLAATGSNTPSGAADLDVQVDVAAAGSADYSGEAALDVQVDLEATGGVEHAGTAALGLQVDLAAMGGHPVVPPPPPWREAIRSDEYLDAISARQITVDARVEIIDQEGTVLATLGGDDADYAGIVSGEVTCDATRDVRWDCSLRVDNSTLTPRHTDDLLHPLSHNRVRVWWRILTGPAQWVEIPVGTYYPDMPSVTDTGDAMVSLTIKGKDASEQIGMAQMLTSMPVGGMRVHEAIRQIISTSAPWATLSLEETNYRLPSDYEAGEPGANPWTACLELARAAGQALYVDRMGVVRTQTESDLSDSPIASFVEGPGCQAVEATAIVPLDEIANRVTVEATASKDENGNELDPFYVTVEETDQDSPLWTGYGYYYDERVKTDSVVTKAQARAYARRVMVESQRLIEDSEMLTFPRPDLSPADVVAVSFTRVGMIGHRRLLGWSLALGDLGGQRNTLTGRRVLR